MGRAMYISYSIRTERRLGKRIGFVLGSRASLSVRTFMIYRGDSTRVRSSNLSASGLFHLAECPFGSSICVHK